MVAAKSVTVTLSERDDKKGSVRFIGSDNDDLLSNIYIPKTAMDKLGDPQKVKITITAA
jgi:hypothetical protein